MAPARRSQRDPVISRGLDEFIQEAQFVVQPVTVRPAWPARPMPISAKAAATRAGFRAARALTWRRRSAPRYPRKLDGHNDFHDYGTEAAAGEPML
ncbi:hypothetical protein AWC15_14135 [Mycobacterium lacus]|nr:hypothetical protein AWC15_14135 [Mycobacterium lacus]